MLEEEIWKGVIPVVFKLGEAEQGQCSSALSVHRLVPRVSFLASHASLVAEHFRTNAIEFASQDSLYFEAAGILLPNFIPIGALFDVLVGTQPTHCWTISIYFRFPPHMEPKIFVDFPLNMEGLYFHSLKQALQILHGNTRRFSEMRVEEQKTIWESVRAGICSNFVNTSEQLLQSLPIKSIPVRLVRKDGTMIQKSIKLVDGETKTLGSIFQEFHLNNYDVYKDEILIHGIKIEGDASLVEVWRILRNPDMFLYISIWNH